MPRAASHLRFKVGLRALLLAVVLLLVPAIARAAADGRVQGMVTDTEGAVVKGARITLIARVRSYRVESDSAGAFALERVLPDTYAVVVSANGYQTLNNRIVAIRPGALVDIDIVLMRQSLGSMATLGTIRVNGTPTLSKASAPSLELDPQELAGQGIEQLSDILSQQIALTMTRPAGGAPGLPQTAALRGPDPSETVIDIDGHQINNSNTGDFDLELLDPSEFQNVQVVYGIGPSSLVGANTQGGAINFRTIDPTAQAHGLLRFSGGSFNTFGETLQATGTADRIGYALSYHRYTTAGQINDYDVIDPGRGELVTLGSAILADSTLAKLRYGLGLGDGFVQVSYRNTTAYRDLTAPLAMPDLANNTAPGAPFTVLEGANSQTIAPAFGLDVQLPLGPHNASGVAPATLIARHEGTLGVQSVPADVEMLGNPYLFNARDHVYDDSLQYDRTAGAGSLTVVYDVRRETLAAPAALAPAPGTQSQTGRSLLARYEWNATPKLDLTAGSYFSSFDTFGRSVDPRLAAVWTPTSDQVIRGSIGTAFRAPLLAERVFNPALTAERTTEYELGYERRFGDGPLAAHGVLNLYRTNLRDPIFFTTDASGALTFLENLGAVVYQGAELRLDKPLTTSLELHGAYGVSIAYPINNPFAFDPAAPNVVAGQQFQGIPPQKAQLSVTARTRSGFSGFLAAAYESDNNELNRPKYATVAAGLTRVVRHTQISLTGHNLTNQYANGFTLPNAGTPYPTPLGLAPTNAYSLQGRSLTLTLTQRY